MSTYLHRNVEVKLTGRVARKQKKTRRSDNSEEVELHEVTPISNEDGSWSAWVDLNDLYKIEVEDNA